MYLFWWLGWCDMRERYWWLCWPMQKWCNLHRFGKRLSLCLRKRLHRFVQYEKYTFPPPPSATFGFLFFLIHAISLYLPVLGCLCFCCSRDCSLLFSTFFLGLVISFEHLVFFIFSTNVFWVFFFSSSLVGSFLFLFAVCFIILTLSFYSFQSETLIFSWPFHVFAICIFVFCIFRSFRFCDSIRVSVCPLFILCFTVACPTLIISIDISSVLNIRLPASIRLVCSNAWAWTRAKFIILTYIYNAYKRCTYFIYVFCLASHLLPTAYLLIWINDFSYLLIRFTAVFLHSFSSFTSLFLLLFYSLFRSLFLSL